MARPKLPPGTIRTQRTVRLRPAVWRLLDAFARVHHRGNRAAALEDAIGRLPAVPIGETEKNPRS